MKRALYLFFCTIFTLAFVGISHAELGGQVFYRYGLTSLNNDRGGEVFTDTLNVFSEGKNDDTSGWDISAGLDIPLTSEIGPGVLLGEVMLDYARFSQEKVTQTTTTLLQLDGVGTHKTKKVTVSELTVVVAPKYRLDVLNGKVRPWIIPAGLAFMVNSPPSDDTTYLDIGYHLGVGVEYRVVDLLSVGVDWRYTIASGEPDIKATYSTFALYLGINF